jgi:hypothetical protein
MFLSKRHALTLISSVLLSAVVTAQQNPPVALTANDYARAERFMSYNTSPLVLHGGVRATWISDNRFWYRTTGDKGAEAWLVDAPPPEDACDLAHANRSAPSTTGSTRRTSITSPDGKKAAFIRIGISGCETWVPGENAAHKDGVGDFGYATGHTN